MWISKIPKIFIYSKWQKSQKKNNEKEKRGKEDKNMNIFLLFLIVNKCVFFFFAGKTDKKPKIFSEYTIKQRELFYYDFYSMIVFRFVIIFLYLK